MRSVHYPCHERPQSWTRGAPVPWKCWKCNKVDFVLQMLQMLSKASVDEVCMCHVVRKCRQFLGLRFALKALPGSCPWTSLGTYVLQTPSLPTTEKKILRVPMIVARWKTLKIVNLIPWGVRCDGNHWFTSRNKYKVNLTLNYLCSSCDDLMKRSDIHHHVVACRNLDAAYKINLVSYLLTYLFTYLRTDSVLCASEDCVILQSIRDSTYVTV